MIITKETHHYHPKVFIGVSQTMPGRSKSVAEVIQRAMAGLPIQTSSVDLGDPMDETFDHYHPFIHAKDVDLIDCGVHREELKNMMIAKAEREQNNMNTPTPAPAQPTEGAKTPSAE